MDSRVRPHLQSLGQHVLELTSVRELGNLGAFPADCPSQLCVCVWFPANRHYSCSVWHTVCYEKGSEDFSSCHFCQHFHDPEDPLFFAKKGCHRYLASPFQHFGSQFGPLSLAPFLCFEEIRSPRAMQHL